MREGLRHRLLLQWSNFVSRHPWWVLIVAGLLAAAAIGITAARLKFNPNRNDLISADLDWNRRFIDWQKHFPGSSDLIVIVDSMEGMPGHRGDHAQARALVDELGSRLALSSEIEHVVWGFDPRAFSPRAAKLLPIEELKAQLQQVEQLKLLLESESLEKLLAASVREAQQQRGGGPSTDVTEESQAAAIVADIQQLHDLFKAVGAMIRSPVDHPVDFESIVSGEQSRDQWQYMTSANGRLYFIRITPRLDQGSLNAFAPAIMAIRSILTEVAPRYPNVEAGLTGIDVVESDETDAATWDSTWTSIVAAVLITILLVTAFHSWRIPLLAMLSLGIAIAWSFGFLTLAIGHLQVLSVVFALILLGLGIDYAIHLSTTYELTRHQYPDTIDGFAQALAQCLSRTGVAMLTGAVTTASAFATTLFTDFTGVAEMGLVAGVGIMLCLLSMFTVFPALLRLFKNSHEHVVPLLDRRVHFYSDQWIRPFVSRPRTTLAITAGLLGLSLLAMLSMRFDYDLLKLQPRGVDSVQWQQRIVDRGQESIWFGVSVVDDMTQARELAKQYRQQPLVSPRLGGVGLLIPPDEVVMDQLLVETRQKLGPALTRASEETPTPASGQGLSTQLALIRQLMTLAFTQDMPAPVRDAMVSLRATLDEIAQSAASLPPEELTARLARTEQAYSVFRQSVAKRLAIMLDAQPLGLDDLPAELMRSYISDQGRLALEMYPVLPENDKRIDGPLSPYFLPEYVKSITAVDPNVTGVVIQVYRSGYLIKTAYQLAGLVALLLVFALVWLDFRSVYDAVLTLVPVAVGFSMTFGVMWLVGMQINPANIIVLPLMFGIGVDAGVHMLHRFRSHPLETPPGLSHGTGKGIALTSYTTMIGFGVMIFASHRGISSLGFVLATGIGLTLLACWTMLAAWLELRRQRLLLRSAGRDVLERML